MYGIRQCNRIFLCGEIGAFFTEIFFQISVVILNSNLHYQIFKFVIDNSDISLNCLQHIQKRRNFDPKVTCHQPICLLLHAILSGVGVLDIVIDLLTLFFEWKSSTFTATGWISFSIFSWCKLHTNFYKQMP